MTEQLAGMTLHGPSPPGRDSLGPREGSGSPVETTHPQQPPTPPAHLDHMTGRLRHRPTLTT
ncbi:hypothetical protein [Streptomyces sp. NBC_01794]|uniref:hypothetical protein n=2 Tax=unclassified Streptomyces TaxID=2593676 RepID=UPI00308D4930|nr:hypothetical protein OIE54_07415 [Streptomyces sp. NBC_01794]